MPVPEPPEVFPEAPPEELSDEELPPLPEELSEEDPFSPEEESEPSPEEPEPSEEETELPPVLLAAPSLFWDCEAPVWIGQLVTCVGSKGSR